MKIVLFADHHARHRAEASELLRRCGCSVVAVLDAADLIETFAAHHDDIALVIVDAELPPTGGAPALRTIQGIIQRNTREIPMFLMSDASALDALSEQELGSVRLLQTPLRHEDVMAALEEPVGDARAEQYSRPTFQWPPAADVLAAIEVVDARTLQRIPMDPFPLEPEVVSPRHVGASIVPAQSMVPVQAARPVNRPVKVSPPVKIGRQGLRRGKGLARTMVRLRRSASPIGTLAATCACVGLLTYVEVRPDQRVPRPSTSAQQVQAQAPDSPQPTPRQQAPRQQQARDGAIVPLTSETAVERESRGPRGRAPKADVSTVAASRPRATFGRGLVARGDARTEPESGVTRRVSRAQDTGLESPRMQPASLAVARGDDRADEYMPESEAPRETGKTLRPMKTISVKTVAKPFTAVWNALRPKRVAPRQPEPDARTPLVAQERGAPERATGEPR